MIKSNMVQKQYLLRACRCVPWLDKTIRTVRDRIHWSYSGSTDKRLQEHHTPSLTLFFTTIPQNFLTVLALTVTVLAAHAAAGGGTKGEHVRCRNVLCTQLTCTIGLKPVVGLATVFCWTHMFTNLLCSPITNKTLSERNHDIFQRAFDVARTLQFFI